MSRIARVSLEGIPYHVTQRGNGRQEVFASATDYQMYLDLLQSNAKRLGLHIWAYCLMPNHIHLVGVPERSVSLAKALGRTHADFARYFNLRHQSCGHVWQARYFSCPLDGTHVWFAMAYVERNPVRAGLVDDAGAYRWSSAGAHTGVRRAPEFLELAPWREQYEAARWREVLRTSVSEEAAVEQLREATLRGRPLGTAEFIEELERKADRPLRPLRAGRPKKKPAEEGQRRLEMGD